MKSTEESKKETSGSLKKDQDEYLNELADSLVTSSHPILYGPLYIIIALTVIGILWASLTKVDEIAIANGKVIPVSGVQIVSSLEGGVLSEVNVREGDIVAEDQVLMRFDPRRFGSQLRETEKRRNGLRATAIRLRAEALGIEPNFPADLRKASPTTVSEEYAAFKARKFALDDSTALIKQSLETLQAELVLSEKLNKDGMLSDVELARLRRQYNDYRVQLLDRVNRFRAEANVELAKLESELSQIGENLIAREDTYDRTILRSPMRATVKNIRYTTIGQAVPAGVPIMELVPIGEKLIIEAKLKPVDVAYVKEGTKATVKLVAYDYTIYGYLTGKVTYVSPDSIKNESAGPDEEPMYYKVLVTTDSATLTHNDRTYQIIPGMTASVEIQTGAKTVMHYILKPLMKSDEAFRER